MTDDRRQMTEITKKLKAQSGKLKGKKTEDTPVKCAALLMGMFQLNKKDSAI